MVLVISLDDDDVKFKVKVTDCITSIAFEDSDITDEFMIFYKPNGIVLTKDASLIVDPNAMTESFVTYQNTDGSIFDLVGKWEYAAKIKFASGGFSQTSQRRIFWVK